jgi:hypothetical protein
MSTYILLSSVLVRNPESRVSLSRIADHVLASVNLRSIPDPELNDELTW